MLLATPRMPGPPAAWRPGRAAGSRPPAAGGRPELDVTGIPWASPHRDETTPVRATPALRGEHHGHTAPRARTGPRAGRLRRGGRRLPRRRHPPRPQRRHPRPAGRPGRQRLDGVGRPGAGGGTAARSGPRSTPSRAASPPRPAVRGPPRPGGAAAGPRPPGRPATAGLAGGRSDFSSSAAHEALGWRSGRHRRTELRQNVPGGVGGADS